jgi:glucose-6-phosphate isomerase
VFSLRNQEVGLWVDVRRMGLSAEDLSDPVLDAAVSAMEQVEAGSEANPDERRQVGHYWLRAPERAPEEAGREIQAAVQGVEALATSIRATGGVNHILLLGIGGSVLGTQFVARALALESGPSLHVLDNTDPTGIRDHLSQVNLARSLVVVVSKSGGTLEVCNALAEVQAAFQEEGLAFPARAVAVSVAGSALWEQAGGWHARLPLWSWVGGRFSVTSAVGLLPLALLGADIRAFLEGAAACDAWTRGRQDNPALLLALAWYRSGEGRGSRSMVVLPYQDRLEVLPCYLQQVVMESVGKQFDLEGNTVHQGLAVYGRKGSTAQHSLVQQLREGPDDFFAAFVTVLDSGEPGVEVAEGVTSSDCLVSMLLGTRNALSEAQRRSLTVALDRVDARSLGAVVALFERAVGFYGSMIGINAYHQPGVEAGKQAADQMLSRIRQMRRGEPVPDDDDTELLAARADLNPAGTPQTR